MPFDDADVQWLQGLGGLDDNIPPGSKKSTSLTQQSVVPVTQDLNNVKVRFGNLLGRGGLFNYQGATLSSTSPIIGLFNYTRSGGVANNLLRVTPSKLELLSSGVWTDVTGAVLAGAATTRPQYTIQNDILILAMEGLSQPIGYGTNSGVGVAYATGTTLGGTPPYAKCLVSYMQFLLLGNVSANGTFTDTFDGWRLIEYSDDPFFAWTGCLGSTDHQGNIDLYQTPGTLLAMKVLGRTCMCYKDDGVIRLTFVGSAIRFTQELIPGSIGCAAPLSVVDLGEFGHAYLGTNGVIYNVQQNGIGAVSFERLSRTLPPKLALQRFKYARGFRLPIQDLYVLLYDSTGRSGQFLDAYVTWNYRTGEFTKGSLGQQVIAGEYFKPTNDSAEVGLVSANQKVYEFDSVNNTKDDDGVKVDRHWTSGWQKLAGEEGYLFGVAAIFRRSTGARVTISVARDFIDAFAYEQTFTLRGSSPNVDFVQLDFRLPSPIFCEWANVKVRIHHDNSTATTEMMRIGFIAKPMHKWASSPQRVGVQGSTNAGSSGSQGSGGGV